MEESKKLKISIFDIVIVAAAVIAAFAVFLLLKPQDVKVAAPDTTPMEYTVELVQIPSAAAELIQPGDAVRESTRNYAIGTVVSYEVRPFTTQSPNEETLEVKNAELGRYNNILLTIRADMLTGSGGLTTESGYQATVGTKIYVSGPCYSGTGYIIAVDRGES